MKNEIKAGLQLLQKSRTKRSDKINVLEKRRDDLDRQEEQRQVKLEELTKKKEALVGRSQALALRKNRAKWLVVKLNSIVMKQDILAAKAKITTESPDFDQEIH